MGWNYKQLYNIYLPFNFLVNNLQASFSVNKLLASFSVYDPFVDCMARVTETPTLRLKMVQTKSIKALSFVEYVSSISVWKQKIEMYLCTFNYETTTKFCLNFRLVRSHIYLAKRCLYNHTAVHIFYIIHYKTLFINRRNWNLLLHKEIEIGHIYPLNEWSINQSMRFVI